MNVLNKLPKDVWFKFFNNQRLMLLSGRLLSRKKLLHVISYFQSFGYESETKKAARKVTRNKNLRTTNTNSCEICETKSNKCQGLFMDDIVLGFPKNFVQKSPHGQLKSLHPFNPMPIVNKWVNRKEHKRDAYVRN